MMGVSVRQSPPLGVVAPFLVTAPLGLALAGVMLLLAGEDSFLAINTPQVVATTHAAVLGWLTLSIMGAVYQLGPAVIGGRLISPSWARIQFFVHVISVGSFVFALQTWDVMLMSLAGVGVAASFIIFLVNAIPAVRWFRRGPIAGLYVSIALVFLVATMSVGVTYLGTLEHLWFPVTMGRLAGHAHLGLVGWLTLTLMGVSYQLVPMFQVVPRDIARFARPALLITAAAAAVGPTVLMWDPSAPLRVAVALSLAIGPALWGWDMVRMIRARSRRKLDIHTRATAVSLVFLAGAAVLGVLVAIGKPVSPAGEPARLQLAYGVLAAGGWAGTALIGNSSKIVPFLVWNARYRELAGTEPVPLVADLANENWMHTSLVLHATAVVVVAAAALVGQLPILHAGGLLLIGAGGCHFGLLLSVLVRRPAAGRPVSSPAGRIAL